MRALKYIVTGTGRCGTGYMSKLMTNAGIACGHERIFTPGGMKNIPARLKRYPWLSADASWMAVPFLGKFPEAVVIHATRHPIDVLSSYRSIHFFRHVLNPRSSSPYARFIREHLPDILLYQNEVTAIAYWIVTWTRRIEQACGKRGRIVYPVESTLADLTRLLGAKSITGISRTTNTRGRHKTLKQSDIVNPRVRAQFNALVQQYGYRG